MFTEVVLHCALLLTPSHPLPVPADPNISLRFAQPVMSGPSLARLKSSISRFEGNETEPRVPAPRSSNLPEFAVPQSAHNPTYPAPVYVLSVRVPMPFQAPAPTL